MHFVGYFVAVLIGFVAGIILGRKLAITIIEGKDYTISAIADAKRAVEAKLEEATARFEQMEADLRLRLKIAIKRAETAPVTVLKDIENKVDGVIGTAPAATEKEIAARF